MDERGVVFFADLCKMFNRLNVNEFGNLNLVFCFLHICISGAVDYDVYFVISHTFSHGIKFRNVEFRHISEDIVIGASFRNYPHLIAELTVGACD